MMTQSNTISDLTGTISNLIQQLQQETVRINTLKILRETEPQKNRPPKWVDGKQIWDAGGYCWKHGYCVDINHNIVVCLSKNGGHQDNAMCANNEAGNKYGKPRNLWHKNIGETIGTIKTNTFSHNICLPHGDPIADIGATLKLFVHE